MKKLFLLAAIIVAASVGSSLADESKKESLVRYYLDTIELRTTLLAQKKSNLDKYSDQVIKYQNITCDPDALKALKEEIENLYSSTFNIDEDMKSAEALYAKSYSEDELKDLIAFYRSPLGLKKVKTDRIIIAELSKNEWAQAEKNDIHAQKEAEGILHKYLVVNHQCTRSDQADKQ